MYMTIDAKQAAQVFAEADRIYSKEEVERALNRMATDMAAQISELDPVILCVMNGGLVPTAGLMARWQFPLQVDYIHATRYRNTTRGGQLDWRVKPHMTLTDRVVVVVDDILDEGITLAAILEACHAFGARDVISAVLLEKHRARSVTVEVNFTALSVEDRYVFGYGMDYAGYLRNAPGIFAVNE